MLVHAPKRGFSKIKTVQQQQSNRMTTPRCTREPMTLVYITVAAALLVVMLRQVRPHISNDVADNARSRQDACDATANSGVKLKESVHVRLRNTVATSEFQEVLKQTRSAESVINTLSDRGNGCPNLMSYDLVNMRTPQSQAVIKGIASKDYVVKELLKAVGQPMRAYSSSIIHVCIKIAYVSIEI